MKLLSVILPDIKYILSPILDTAHTSVNGTGKKVFSEVDTTYNSCWNAFLYVDVRLERLHTERDWVDTLITVPIQIDDSDLS